MAITKVSIASDEKFLARLALKKYSQRFTEVPNSVLPKTLKSTLNNVYQHLVGAELPEDDFTLLVKATDTGEYVKLFTPAVYGNAKENQLVIKWGGVIIPIKLEAGKLTLTGDAKSKISFSTETVFGYPALVLNITFGKKDMTSMSFPVRVKSLEDEVDPLTLDLFVDGDDIESILELLLDSESKSSGGQLVGDIIKVGNLPLGVYPITAIRRFNNAYGVQHLLQTEVEIPFKTITSYQKEDGEWGQKEIEAVGKVILKANNKLNKLLAADPSVSPENPASLRVIGKGNYNGYETSEIEFDCDAYNADEDLMPLTF